MSEKQVLLSDKEKSAIDDLQALVQEYDEQLHGLNEQRQKIDAESQKIATKRGRALEALSVLMPGEEFSQENLSHVTETANGNHRQLNFKDMRAKDALDLIFLDTKNAPLEVAPLTELLFKGGWESTASDPKGSIASVLSRESRYEHTLEGYHLVAEYYETLVDMRKKGRM